MDDPKTSSVAKIPQKNMKSPAIDSFPNRPNNKTMLPVTQDNILHCLTQYPMIYPRSWKNRTRSHLFPANQIQYPMTAHAIHEKLESFTLSTHEYDSLRSKLEMLYHKTQKRHTEFDALPKMNGKIYVIFNHVNGKYKFGQTTQSLQRRFQTYFREARNKQNSRDHLFRSIRKYGEQHFSIHKVCSVPKTKKWILDRFEGYFIIKFNSLNRKIGYNKTITASGGIMTNEIKNKLSQSHLDKKLTPQTKTKISNSLKGRTRTAQTKHKISNALQGRCSPMKGRKQSPSHTAKIAYKNRGKKRSQATRQLMSQLNTGIKHPQYGMPRSEKTKAKISLTRKQKHLQHTEDSWKKSLKTIHLKFIKKYFPAYKAITAKDLPLVIDEIRDNMIQDIKAGYNNSQIAQKHGLTQNSIRNLYVLLFNTRSITNIRKNLKVDPKKLVTFNANSYAHNTNIRHSHLNSKNTEEK